MFADCISIRGRQPTKIKNKWKNNKMIYKIQVQEKRSAPTQPKVKKKDMEEMFVRYKAYSTCVDVVFLFVCFLGCVHF